MTTDEYTIDNLRYLAREWDRIAWHLDGHPFGLRPADPNSPEYAELAAALQEARAAQNDLRMAAARSGRRLAGADPNRDAVELAELDLFLTYADGQIQRLRIILPFLPPGPARQAEQMLAQLRARKRQWLTQYREEMEIAMENLSKLELQSDAAPGWVRQTLEDVRRALWNLRDPHFLEYLDESRWGAVAAEPREDGNDLPEFPLPPPEPSAMEVIPRRFLAPASAGPQTLGDIDKRLETALDECGYFDLRYFQVSEGFAVATRIEKINEDGTPKEGPERWNDDPGPLRSVSFWKYLRALIMARPGHFRIIVFVVTPLTIRDTGPPVDHEEAEIWIRDGGDRLPSSIGQKEYTSEHKCTALIYEFEKPNPGEQGEQRVPGLLQGKPHLMAAGLWNVLENQP
jgi:hypothetical protein